MLDFYIKTYGPRLYGLCRSLCASPFDADDLYQETWLKVIRFFPQYDPSRDFEPWLARICINTYRSAWRRMGRIPISHFYSNEEKEAALEKMTEEKKDDYSDLYHAVARLPEKLRITVLLFYFRDMDECSAADILGIPVGTVKSRLHKARKLLKEMLKDEPDLSL